MVVKLLFPLYFLEISFGWAARFKVSFRFFILTVR